MLVDWLCYFFFSSLKPKQVDKELDELAESAKRERGKRITLEIFADYLKLPITDALTDIFALFDEVNYTLGKHRIE